MLTSPLSFLDAPRRCCVKVSKSVCPKYNALSSSKIAFPSPRFILGKSREAHILYVKTVQSDQLNYQLTVLNYVLSSSLMSKPLEKPERTGLNLGFFYSLEFYSRMWCLGRTGPWPLTFILNPFSSCHGLVLLCEGTGTR